jgi:hypothetical protein
MKGRFTGMSLLAFVDEIPPKPARAKAGIDNRPQAATSRPIQYSAAGVWDRNPRNKDSSLFLMASAGGTEYRSAQDRRCIADYGPPPSSHLSSKSVLRREGSGRSPRDKSYSPTPGASPVWSSMRHAPQKAHRQPRPVITAKHSVHVQPVALPWGFGGEAPKYARRLFQHSAMGVRGRSPRDEK